MVLHCLGKTLTQDALFGVNLLFLYSLAFIVRAEFDTLRCNLGALHLSPTEYTMHGTETLPAVDYLVNFMHSVPCLQTVGSSLETLIPHLDLRSSFDLTCSEPSCWHNLERAFPLGFNFKGEGFWDLQFFLTLVKPADQSQRSPKPTQNILHIVRMCKFLSFFF